MKEIYKARISPAGDAYSKLVCASFVADWVAVTIGVDGAAPSGDARDDRDAIVCEVAVVACTPVDRA